MFNICILFLGMVYGTTLKVIGIEINTTLSYFTLGYPEGKPIYELWENFINGEVIHQF